jgi:hypothetical protein
MSVTTNGITTPTTGDAPNVPADLLVMAGTITEKIGDAVPKVTSLLDGAIAAFGVAAAGGATPALYANTFTMPAEGAYWLEVEVSLPIYRGDTSSYAGYLDIAIGGVDRRNLRFANGGSSTLYPVFGTAKHGPFAAGAVVAVNIDLRVDGPSATIGWMAGTLAVRRITATGT